MAITDYVDVPELPAVPGLPDVPDMDSLAGPGVTDFETFSLFTACVEKQALFTAKSLKLQSVVLTSMLLISKIRTVMEPMLGIEQDEFTIPNIGDINIDMGINRITSPKIDPLPKCLADTITNTVSTAGQNGMKDILDPFNSAIGEINSLTSAATPTLQGMADTFTNSINMGINEVNKLMKKTMNNIVSKGDKELFEMLDNFQKFIKDTHFVDNYREWKDIYKCLKNNCKPLEDYLYDDGFLYYDDEKKRFIVPIDVNSGRIRLRKFFEFLTKDQQRQCDVIERRYFKYVSDKHTVLAKAAQEAKKKGIEDNKNPFTAVLESETNKVTDTFNNLF